MIENLAEPVQLFKIIFWDIQIKAYLKIVETV